MSFVNDHVDPLVPGEQRSILDDVLVRREQDLEVALTDLPSCRFALHRCAFVSDDLDRGSPFLELHDPVRHRRQRDNDEEGPILLLHLDQVREKRDRLNGFAETHLVRENAVDVIVVERHHPFETFDLVLFQFATNKDRRLRFDFLLDPVRNLVVVDLVFCFLFENWRSSKPGLVDFFVIGNDRRWRT